MNIKRFLCMLVASVMLCTSVCFAASEAPAKPGKPEVVTTKQTKSYYSLTARVGKVKKATSYEFQAVCSDSPNYKYTYSTSSPSWKRKWNREEFDYKVKFRARTARKVKGKTYYSGWSKWSDKVKVHKKK